MSTNSEPQVNPVDIELLSAYIDHQLSTNEQTALEQRLQREPALHNALDELQTTVQLLRALEPLSPLRSFSIDTASAASQRGWVFPWRVFGSGLIAVVCLLAFGFVLIRNSGHSASSIAAAPTVAPTAAPLMNAAAAAPTAAPLMNAAEPATAELPVSAPAAMPTPAQGTSDASGAADATIPVTPELSPSMAQAERQSTDTSLQAIQPTETLPANTNIAMPTAIALDSTQSEAKTTPISGSTYPVPNTNSAPSTSNKVRLLASILVLVIVAIGIVVIWRQRR